jgi:NADH-quinone oxidoreductase subunit H
MTFAAILLILVKVIVAIAYLFTGAIVAVWADRRQGAFIQDRIGPERAVVFLPRRVVQAALFGLGLGAAAVVMVALPQTGPGAARTAEAAQHLAGRMVIGVELAIFVLWFGLLLTSAHARRHGPTNDVERALGDVDPRLFFFGGVVAQLCAFPLLRMVPARSLPVGAAAGEATAGVLLLVAGLYAGHKLPEGKVGIRIAGLIHPVADALKMAWKEDTRPKKADRLLFALAPFVAMIPVLITFAVIPFGSTMCFHDVGRDGGIDFGDLLHPAAPVSRLGGCAAGQLAVALQIADLNVGLLYIFAVSGMGVVGAAIAGWASNNKFALLGGLRAISQMISYEVAIGLTIVGMLMIAGSVHMQTIVDWQGQNAWGLFVQPFGFLLFLVALVAETKRTPFDQPEGESEIVAGYFLEYSGLKFGMFYVGEYAEFAFSIALLVTLFFGGYHLPFVNAQGIDVVVGGSSLFAMPLPFYAVTLLHVVSFFGKCLLIGWLVIFIRWTLPRFRYDQVMELGWKKLLPLSLANVVGTGVAVLLVTQAGPAVEAALRLCADLSQALVAVGALVAVVLLLSWLVEPTHHQRFLRSSAARFAAAGGGVKTERMGA